MQSKKAVGHLKLTVQKAELYGFQFIQNSQVFVQIVYQTTTLRTQSTTNQEDPNQPEWNTTISLDIYDLSESLSISVFF
jgi:Ca2+-dependent lipid-binding protein